MNKCTRMAFKPGLKLFSRFPDECTGKDTTCWWIITLWNLFQLMLTHCVDRRAYKSWVITTYFPFSQRVSLEWRYT